MDLVSTWNILLKSYCIDGMEYLAGFWTMQIWGMLMMVCSGRSGILLWFTLSTFTLDYNLLICSQRVFNMWTLLVYFIIVHIWCSSKFNILVSAANICCMIIFGWQINILPLNLYLYIKEPAGTLFCVVASRSKAEKAIKLLSLEWGACFFAHLLFLTYSYNVAF